MSFLSPTRRSERRGRHDSRPGNLGKSLRHWQLGPRIRIGGTLGKIGQEAKIGVGKALSNPIVDGALTLVPGVGPGLAAAAGATGRALDTSNGGLHGLAGVGSLAAGAAEGYGAGKIAGAVKTGVGSLLKDGLGATAAKVFGGGSGTADGTVASDPGSAASTPSLTDRIESVLGKGASALGLGSGTSAGGGGNSLIDDLLLGGSVASQAADKSHMSDLQNQAIQSATGAYNEKAPLRARALASLSTDQAAPDLSSIFVDPGNPYARQRAGMAPLTATPSAASQMTSGNALSGALAARVPASVPTSVGAAS